MNNEKPIHAWIFNPTKSSLFKSLANDRAHVEILYCSNSENCELFKKKLCIHLWCHKETHLPLGGGMNCDHSSK